MRIGVVRPGPPSVKRHRAPVASTTRLGSWAVRLAAAGIVLFLSWRLIPGGAAAGMVLWLVGGVLALVAILRHQERAIAVFATLVPLVFTILFVLAELIIGHD